MGNVCDGGTAPREYFSPGPLTGGGAGASPSSRMDGTSAFFLRVNVRRTRVSEVTSVLGSALVNTLATALMTDLATDLGVDFDLEILGWGWPAGVSIPAAGLTAEASVFDAGFFFTVGGGLALDKAVDSAAGLTLTEIPGAAMRVGEDDFFLAAGTISAREPVERAEAFLTGFFSATAAGPALAGAAVFLEAATVLPVNVFETRVDDVFFAEMGDGLAFITKKSLL